MNQKRGVNWLLAAGVCLFALIMYFPTAFGGGGLILPADILYTFPPFNSFLPVEIQNILLSDPVMHMYPWFAYGRDMFWNGDIPLWNNLVNAGAPLVANDQSAFFFPLNILGYLLPVKAGWNFVILAKLTLAYTGMWLFLRHKGVGKAGRSFGALTFMLSGSMMIWLGWPHTNVIMTLPWLFYTLRAWYLNRQYRWALAFIAVVATQFLGGFVEESAHVLFFTGLYGLLLIAQTREVRPQDRFSSALMMLLMVVLGTALAAVQLAPFAEFVLQTTAVAKRSHPGGYGFLKPDFVVTWLVPNFYGNQVYRSWSAPANYNETVGYAGVGALVLALTGIWRRRRETFLYALLTVICFGLIYNVPGVVLLKSLPGFNMALTGRLLMTAAFLITILAAYGVDSLAQSTADAEQQPAQSRFMLSTIGVYLVTPLVFAFGRDYLGDKLLAERRTWIVVAASLALSAVFAVWARARTFISARAFVSLVLIAQFVDLYNFSKPYNPTVPGELAYPEIPMVEFLRRDMKVGDRFIGIDRVLPPNLSVAYGIPDLRNSDAMYMGRDTALMKALDLGYENLPDKYSLPVDPDVQLLAALGITHVVGRVKSPPGVRVLLEHTQSSSPVGEIYGPQVVYQEFTSAGEPIGAIDIMLATYARKNEGLFEVALLRDGQTLAAKTVDMSQVQDNAYFRMEFPPVESKAGQKLGIKLSSPTGKPGSALTAWYDPSTQAPGTSLQVGGRSTPGTLRFRVYGVSRTQLEKLWEDEHGYAIWRLKDARPFAYLASQVVIAPEAKALEMLVALSRDPGRAVVVEQDGQIPAGRGEVLSFQRPSAGNIEVSVRADEASLLVVNEKFSPGWKATIDGADTETMRANYVFTAVPVPPGNHVVRLVYRPLGWTLGWMTSVATLLVLLTFGGLRWYLRKLMDRQTTAADAGGSTKQVGVI